MSTLTDEDLAKVINMGGAIKGKPLMPGNPQITGADLKALVAYTRSLSTNSSARPLVRCPRDRGIAGSRDRGIARTSGLAVTG